MLQEGLRLDKQLNKLGPKSRLECPPPPRQPQPPRLHKLNSNSSSSIKIWRLSWVSDTPLKIRTRVKARGVIIMKKKWKNNRSRLITCSKKWWRIRPRWVWKPLRRTERQKLQPWLKKRVSRQLTMWGSTRIQSRSVSVRLSLSLPLRKNLRICHNSLSSVNMKRSVRSANSCFLAKDWFQTCQMRSIVDWCRQIVNKKKTISSTFWVLQRIRAQTLLTKMNHLRDLL